MGVLTQYRPLELNSYIGSGVPWDLDGTTGGVHILPPYMGSKGGTWYKGTANAIYQNIGFIDLYDPEYVVVLSGDHIYKMDYSKMVERHKATGAACTISVMEVPWSEASRFGIMNVDEADMITEFAEKPKEPKSNLASMGIYVFTWQTLRAVSGGGRGRSQLGERLRQERHPRHAGGRRADGRLSLQRLLEGRGHAGVPVGRQHGHALAGVRPGPAGRVLAHLRPVRQRAAGIPGAAPAR